MSSTLKNNSSSLQEILSIVQSLPNASSGEDLSEVLADQDALLTELERVSAGKIENREIADFGYVDIPNYETCTLTYNELNADGAKATIYYMTTTNGRTISFKAATMNSTVTSTTCNPLKGFPIIIASRGYYYGTISVSGSETVYSTSGSCKGHWVILGDADTVEINTTWSLSTPPIM